MSFSVEIEHSWMPPHLLPRHLVDRFPNGAAVVFADQEFTAAIPATNEQTSELADLMEIASAGGLKEDDIAMKEYCKLRDELCAPTGYQMLSYLFKSEMEKIKDIDEADNSKYLKLATAAKPKFIN